MLLSAGQALDCFTTVVFGAGAGSLVEPLHAATKVSARTTLFTAQSCGTFAHYEQVSNDVCGRLMGRCATRDYAGAKRTLALNGSVQNASIAPSRTTAIAG